MSPPPEILALIPARGGSRSIPRKNLIPVAGQPLVSYSIAHALASRRVTRTIVSTDDDEIAEVARRFGAEVPFKRPAQFAQDLSPDIDVFVHALTWLEKEQGYRPDLVLHLRPTGPIRRVELIDEAIDRLLADTEADSLRSVALAVQNPFKMWLIKGGYMTPVAALEGVKDFHSLPRQQLPLAYRQNGYVDVVRTLTVLEKHSMAGDKVLPFIVEETPNDIDYPEDIAPVEAMIQHMRQGDVGSKVRRSPLKERYPV